MYYLQRIKQILADPNVRSSKYTHYKKMFARRFPSSFYPVCHAALGEVFILSDGSAIVGDAAMHPAELVEPHGNIDPRRTSPTPGIVWLHRIATHFERSVWLNPGWTGSEITSFDNRSATGRLTSPTRSRT